VSAARGNEPADKKATESRSGPVLNLPTEFPPERLDALTTVLARLLAARALQAMRKEPANED